MHHVGHDADGESEAKSLQEGRELVRDHLLVRISYEYCSWSMNVPQIGCEPPTRTEITREPIRIAAEIVIDLPDVIDVTAPA